MQDKITRTRARQAAAFLAAHDPLLAPIIQRAGPCTIAPHGDYYRELVESIIGQQLSVGAAAAIRARFLDLFDGVFPAPAAILTKPVDTLRAAGLSRAKATYIRDIAQHVIDGALAFDHLDTMSNDDIMATLTAVKGVGPWTANMFLMFCMGRMDVLATGDLGIRSGIQKLYGLEQLPSATEIEALASTSGWHPYATIACWYIWFSLDNKPM